ncbi:MAG: DUF3318 domain-containing protein, partial [Leptolyngbyaceae bacterium]|nr:DUF3318 domain-containing protein [Leptolyngbyaceae bacterium]
MTRRSTSSSNSSSRLDWRRMSSRLFGTNRSESWRRGEPVDSDPEMGRLLDLMPASGRMLCRLVNQPVQSVVIAAELPLPWNRSREIRINVDLWNQMPRPQRDLLFLRTVCWSVGVQWFKFEPYRVLAAVGAVGVLVEAAQSDAVGVIVAGGMAALAGTQVWRQRQGTQTELEADESALQVAQRRGYTEAEAARHLSAAIETVAQIEGRPSLSFVELLRSQNLRAIAGLSPVGVPESVRNR